MKQRNNVLSKENQLYSHKTIFNKFAIMLNILFNHNDLGAKKTE